MKRRPWTPLLIVLTVVLVLATGTWIFLFRQDHPEARSSGGIEIEGLRENDAETEPPNAGEIVSVPCRKDLKLRDGEFIVGLPGAYLKVTTHGEIVPSTGEELASLNTAYDPLDGDKEFPIRLECADDVEDPGGSLSWYVSSLKTDQFFSTKKSVRIETKISRVQQEDFRSRINTNCILQADPEGRSSAPKSACVRPVLRAITDLNGDGKKEYWFDEPFLYDTGLGVIEEPARRLLTTCVGCSDPGQD